LRGGLLAAWVFTCIVNLLPVAVMRAVQQ